MGGKTSKSTQTVSIPPEVLARYNAVNARAEEVAGRPFQPYSYNPADFVAQLTPTQLAGIQNVNYAAGQAQPYYEEATNQLMGAQMGAVPYYAQAGQDIGYGQQMGQMYQQQALQDYYAGRAGAQPLQQAAGYNIGAAQDIGAQLAQQAYAQQAMAGAMAQPINQRAYADLATAYGSAQPLNQAAVQQYYSGLAAAQPLQQYALGTLGRAGQIGEQISGQALGTVGEGLGMARPVQFENLARADQVYGAAQPYIGRADLAYQRGLGRAEDLQQYALGTLGQGQDISQMLSGQALGTLGRGELRAEPLQQLAQGIYGQAYQAAQPFTQAALQQYYGGLGAAGPLSQAAQQNIAAAQAGVAPYQQFATELGMAAARPVTPGALTGREIQQYMSPYMSSVVGQTQALLNQQANQAQAEQLGNAIRSGAFGGDRSRIAAANLQQQQQLAQGKVLSDLLQSGYGQALGTAQQQQQLALGAEQANRAAQQAAAAQLLGVGQAGFGQGITAAQQQAALAQQLFGQQAAAGQNIAGLGQQAFGQGLATGQAQQALAQQLFGQGATTAAQQQAIAESLFGRGATAAAQQAALGAQTFGQNQAVAQGLAALGQQQFGQGMANIAAREATAQNLFNQSAQAAQQQAAIAQQLFGQGATQAAQQAALAQQAFGQNQAVGQNVAQMAQQLYGQGIGTAQAQAAIGAQQFAQQMQQAQQQQALSQLLYGQGMGAAQQQAALGQQIFGQGLAGSQQLGALGQQGFAQQLAAAQARQGLGQGLYGMGAGTAQQLAALGTGAQGAALTGAQAQLAAGQAQQQTAQAGLQALYNQFLQQQAYPYQAAQFLANIATGTGALSGSTQTAVTPGGLLSDVRMKENIRKVGETFDKQPIYSYNYKGDDKTQMGMLAQEVEQKHPEAVGLAGGMKTVDYDKATRNSVRKPVTIDGEYTSSEGGPVLPHRAGEGFARGGYADGGMPGLASPTDMAALLAAQAQMFGPFSDAGRQTGGLPGMGGYVPAANLPVSELVTPGPMPEAPDAIGQMQKIADIGKTGNEIYEKYKEKQAEKSAAKALNTTQANPVVSAARRAAADGGAAVMPYTADQTTALNIPSQKMETKKLDVPEMPKGRSAMDDVAAIANIAATVMSMSDSRVKEDIKHIGNTYDGQKIYSYRYKGEPQTHIGLLAQEVEKKHPEAVGNIKGVKMVDYDMATEEAAKRAVDLARGKADGGAIMPYSTPTSLGIPTGDLGGRKLDVPDMPEGRSALDDLSKLSSTASDIKSLTTKPKKYAGGRTGYATDGSVKDETDIFSLRHQAPGLYDEKGNLKPWAAATGKFLQERFVDNPAINPMAAMRRAEANARAQVPGAPPQTGLAAAVNAVVPSAQAANASSQASATTNRPQRRDTAPAAGANDARPVDNKDVFPASAFANLPETPAEGLAGATGQSPGVPPAPTGLAPSAPASVSGSADLGMAPMLGGTMKPTKAEVVAKDRSAPVESRMDAFLNWVRQPQNFIPLATGIAAATAAPTRNTFVALAQGLGAGAQAYQPVLKKQADIAQTKAETEQTQMQTAVARAGIPTSAIISDAQGRTLGIRVYVNGQLEIIPPGEFFRRQGAGERFQFVPDQAGAAPGQPGQAPAPAVAAPSPAAAAVPVSAAQRPLYEAIPQDLAQGIIQRANDVQSTGIPALAAAKENNPFTEQAISANAQRSNRQQRNILAKSFADLPAGQSGIFAEQIANPIFNWINSTLTSFGVSPEFLRENIRDPQDLANQQVINKITTQLAAQMQAEGGGVSLGKFTSLLESIPRLYNTKEGQAELVASIYTQAQRELDLDRFYNMYRDRLQTEGGLNSAQSGYAGRGLEAEFSRRQDPTYGIEKNVISKMFMEKVKTPDGQEVPLLSYVISQGGNIPAGLQRLIKDKYSKKDASGKVIYDASQILRYFGGG